MRPDGRIEDGPHQLETPTDKSETHPEHNANDERSECRKAPAEKRGSPHNARKPSRRLQQRTRPANHGDIVGKWLGEPLWQGTQGKTTTRQTTTGLNRPTPAFSAWRPQRQQRNTTE
eukprot:15451020-Alexandrium_andersonii.AAC.1